MLLVKNTNLNTASLNILYLFISRQILVLKIEHSKMAFNRLAKT
jgi:hypothetical protein